VHARAGRGLSVASPEIIGFDFGFGFEGTVSFRISFRLHRFASAAVSLRAF
jgi:hypothetical protein